MFPPGGHYWAGTRHPWSCVVFVLPLLALYELGLYFLGPTPAALLRNGADVWLRSGLTWAGLAPTYAAPVILVLILLAWALLYREKRPRDPVGVWIGMSVESVVFAAVLYGASQVFWPLLYSLNGVPRSPGASGPALMIVPLRQEMSATRSAEPVIVELIRFVGAGIYEEALFRLLFFSGLLAAFSLGELPRRWSIGLAALASALLFAGAHNLGPRGEVFDGALFVFRTVAGIYFAWVYCCRGFGIAVGAHAGYDVMVGLLMKPA